MKFLFLFVLVSLPALAQETEKSTPVTDLEKVVSHALSSKWYERIHLRGYAQLRYNRVLETNERYTCSVCDKSLGKNQGLFLRRGRLTFFGDVSDRVFIYVQPDYAQEATSSVNGGSSTQTQNYFSLRDAYFDYALDPDKVYRLRFGISKIPYGYDNLQSSGNRAAFDRTDALNSGIPNERDTAVIFMFAPPHMRKRFKELTAHHLKGTGDYGMFAFGIFNGQTLNRSEQNEDLHRVIRFTYPWKTSGGQFYEASLQAYEGKYDTNSSSAVNNRYEQRSAATFVMYPQPIGFIAEWNVGQGPEFNPKKNKIESQDLSGGFFQVNYQHQLGNHRFFPYIRWQNYRGGRKLDNSASVFTEELELGTEWAPNQAVEFTIAWAQGNRLRQSNLTDKTHEDGSLVRLQAQFNY